MTALTIPEVAKELGISRALAYRMLKTEGLPHIRLSARRVIVRREDLEVWIAGRVVNPVGGGVKAS